MAHACQLFLDVGDNDYNPREDIKDQKKFHRVRKHKENKVKKIKQYNRKCKLKKMYISRFFICTKKVL